MSDQILLAAIADAWPALLETINPINPRLRAVLAGCRPLTIERDIVTIAAPSPFHLTQIEAQDNRRLIEAALATHHGRPLWVAGRQVARPVYPGVH